MKEKVSNLLSSLYPWAHRQGENFTTEALVWTLRTLLVYECDEAVEILSWLCFGQSGQLRPPVNIGTQHSIDEGRPDISVEAPGVFVFIEVKTESPLGPDQVARYLTGLVRCQGNRRGALVLLTRDTPDLTTNQEEVVRCIRWYELALRLGKVPLTNSEAKQAVALLNGFLKERVMTLERVDWQLVGGIKALQHLAEMIGAALKAANVPVHQRTVGHTWVGCYVGTSAALWAGISYFEPTIMKVAFDPGMADRTKFDEQGTGEWCDGKSQWTLDLDCEAVHFFSRTADSQLACLTDFFRQAYPQACACLP